MFFRGVIAASCVVVALAAPAQAQDGCTSRLADDLVEALTVHEEGENPYPIVEQDPQTGSVTVHPQNVGPSVGYSLAPTIEDLGEITTAVTTWADCVG